MKYLDPNRFCSLTVHESDIKLEQRPCRYNAFTLDFHLTLMQHCVRLTQNTSRTAHHCALGLSRFLHTGKSTWLHRRTNRKKPHQIAYAVLHLCGEPAEDNTNGGEKKRQTNYVYQPIQAIFTLQCDWYQQEVSLLSKPIS